MRREARVLSTDPNPNERPRARGLDGVWLLLMALTFASVWLGDIGAVAGRSTAGVVLGLAFVKASLVAGVFMELFGAPRVWCVVMGLFLLSLTGLLYALYAA